MKMADAHQDLLSLVRKLNDPVNYRDLRLMRACIYEVLILSTNGCDVSVALPTVVKLLAHTDTFIKRVAGELIGVHAEQNPEMVLLATNTLVQDCKDVNPVVRGHGLRILGSLQSASTVEMLSTAVTEGLEDSSLYVRRFAALAATSLYQISPSTVTEGGLWDLLYSHLSDPDPITVASCICALEEILSKENGVVVSNKLGQYLISSVPSFTPTVQRFILQFLLKHSPKSKAQMFDHLNDLDESICKSNSLATTLCALELFCHLTTDLPKVKTKAFATAWSSLKQNLALERNEEVVTAVMDYLSTTNFPVSICVQDYNKFFCRDDESVFLIKQKIRMLSKLITSENAVNIFEELVWGARHLDTSAVREMIYSVTQQMGTKPEVENLCVDFLKTLMQLGVQNVLECVIQALPSVNFSDENHWSTLAPSIQETYTQIESMSGKIALLEVIRSHSSLLENAPEILEEMLAEQEERQQEEEEGRQEDQRSQYHPQHHQHMYMQEDNNKNKLKLSLLGAMVKMCLEKPAKMQPLLAKFLELCVKDHNRNVRDRALFLYGYLQGRARQGLTVNLTTTTVQG